MKAKKKRGEDLTPDLDIETVELIRKVNRLASFVKGDDWAYIKDKFHGKILDLQSIKNLPQDNAENIINDIKVRHAVVDILQEIIREVEGEAAQSVNSKIKTDIEIDTFIMNLDREV